MNYLATRIFHKKVFCVQKKVSKIYPRLQNVTTTIMGCGNFVKLKDHIHRCIVTMDLVLV